MLKWVLHHNLAKAMGLDIPDRVMREIDDLIDAPPNRELDLRRKFLVRYTSPAQIFPVQPKIKGIARAGRTDRTLFKKQVRFISEHYGVDWNQCEKNEYCRKLISYYMFHHLVAYFFNDVLPEGVPNSEKVFISRMDTKFVQGAWNCIVHDPEFKWLSPVYYDILRFLYSKIRRCRSLPEFCEDGHGLLENFMISRESVRVCPVCGAIYVKEKNGGD